MMSLAHTCNPQQMAGNPMMELTTLLHSMLMVTPWQLPTAGKDTHNQSCLSALAAALVDTIALQRPVMQGTLPSCCY